jgi:hypothetical protein
MATARNLQINPYLATDGNDDDSSLTAALGPSTQLIPSGMDSDFSAVSAVTTVHDAAQAMVLYLTEPGTTTAISAGDLYQGQIGDCFLISSIGELAMNKPTAISNMIQANSDGSETVTLYEAANGKLPQFGTMSYKAVQVVVTNTFPTYSVDNGATQDVVGNQKEIWPQVLEKAVATLDGGYGAIANGGSPISAMEELTGKVATYMSPSNLTLTELQSYVKAGDLIVMDTPNSNSLPDGLVGDHAYMFNGVTGTGSSAMVHLLNPWGFDQPSAIMLSQLSKGITEVDIGQVR